MKNEQDKPQQGPDVTVTVDNETKTVHRGHYVVSEFKSVVGVDASKALDAIIDGEIKPLQDDGKLVIKGGEKFISHVRTGAAA